MGGLVKGTQKPYQWDFLPLHHLSYEAMTTSIFPWAKPFYKTESVVETDSTHGTKARNQWY